MLGWGLLHRQGTTARLVSIDFSGRGSMSTSRSEASQADFLGHHAGRRKPTFISVATTGNDELVRRLEAENQELRTRAVNLALQIQALQEAKPQLGQ